MLAPIVLFAYSRLDHVQQTVISLLSNEYANESDLIVYLDAAKTPNLVREVESVFLYLNKISGFRSVTIRRRPINFGLSRSIISGVSEVLTQYKSAIILEDDLVISPFFLRYMNEGLKKYEFDARVASIHGYCFRTENQLPEAFFLRGSDCWGWATWSRAWNYFNPDGQNLYDQLKSKKLIRKFDFNGSYPYSKMLKDQIMGRNDSWAIRWYASTFLRNMLTLYPGQSLVRNIGIDNSGTHCKLSYDYDVQLSTRHISLNDIEVIDSKMGRKEFINFFKKIKKSFWRRFIEKFFKDLNAKSNL